MERWTWLVPAAETTGVGSNLASERRRLSLNCRARSGGAGRLPFPNWIMHKIKRRLPAHLFLSLSSNTQSHGVPFPVHSLPIYAKGKNFQVSGVA